MSIFDEQINRKPDLYPWAESFIKAIWEGFWTDAEFSFASDKQDFYTKLTDQEKEIIVRTLSAIGQIEIAVKTFWVKLGDNLPHPSIRDMGIVMGNSECYSEDTEVLTPNGWVLLKEMKIGDEVYQYTEDSFLEPTQVRNTIAKYYEGTMYEFGKTNSSNNCLVTPDHDMVVKRQKINNIWKIEKLKAKDVKSHGSIQMPKTVLYNGGNENNLTDLEKLFIAIQADGSVSVNYDSLGNIYRRGKQGGYTHQIRLKKIRKINRLRNILKKCNIKYNETNNDKYTLFYIYLNDYFTYDYKDFSWVNLSQKTANWCREFVEELIEWDGNRRQRAYFSKNKKNVDFCQHVGILAGLNSTVGFTPDFRKNKDQTKYRVLFSRDSKLWRGIADLSYKSVNYNNTVHCITVDSGMILTRRGGKTFIAGNCVHNMAYERLLEELDLTTRFEENLKLEWIQGRVNYLRKYTKKFHSDNKKQFIYSLILFTLFVENISLFSQFYIINWFGRRNLLKDTNQQTGYTLLEEDLHAKIGTKLINTIKEEHPELFTEDLEKRIYDEAIEAYNAESKIVDWMINGIQDEHLSGPILKEFIKNRINESLRGIGYNNVFEIDKNLLSKTLWFDEQHLGNGMTDFFHSRPVEYSKHNQSFDPEDII